MSELLEKMFEWNRWNELIDNANDKGIEVATLKKLCEPDTRVRLYFSIKTGNYEIAPPHIAKIPKDNGDFREVFVNEPVDRVVLTLINECVSEMFKDEIHPSCKSYQKGIGCQEIVKDVSRAIVELDDMSAAWKCDLSKFFDSCRIECIDAILDKLERRLNYEKGTEPVINILRKYYHNDFVFDVEGNLIEHYGSLKQGCAFASFLANVMLYEIDTILSNMDIIYVRYSDDILMIGKDANEAKMILESMLPEYGLHLNPKKVEKLDADHWFKFLGFNIKGELITLSKSRVKKFQKEIEKRTIKKKNTNLYNARRSIIKYLYEGEYCWATSCLSTVNCEHDINEMNKFIMDCLRAVQTGKKKVGGLGVVDNLPDRTILRGTGKNVTSNRQKTEKMIENYLTVGCLTKALKMNKTIYGACVRSMR